MEYELKPFKEYPHDLLGWINASLYKPPDFIIVEIETNYRQIRGWWTGQDWFIRKPKENEVVKNWKKIREFYNIH